MEVEIAPGAITDVPGIGVGHAQDLEALTGCTVVLCDERAVGGVSQRGGAPGTRETDPLRPMHLVQRVDAVVLSGGSAFGLESATGVVRYLEEQGRGFDVRILKVPIVPAAVLFDLAVGRADVRPDAAMGYAACEAASSDAPLQGNVGAGTGATVGKSLGLAHAVKSGIGTASLRIGSGIVVGALAAVNAFGDVVDPNTGRTVAGARRADADDARGRDRFADAMTVLAQQAGVPMEEFGAGENTIVAVVASNARLDKEATNKVAEMAHDGIARTIRPAHTMLDGDTVFALSTGQVPANASIVGAFAAEALAWAILNAVIHARSVPGIPGWEETKGMRE